MRRPSLAHAQTEVGIQDPKGYGAGSTISTKNHSRTDLLVKERAMFYLTLNVWIHLKSIMLPLKFLASAPSLPLVPLDQLTMSRKDTGETCPDAREVCSLRYGHVAQEAAPPVRTSFKAVRFGQ